MTFDKLFEAPNVLFVLPFYIIPEGAQLLIVLSIGDVLVVAPQCVQAFAQIVYHIVVMIGGACGFTHFLSLFLCRECHNFSPLGNLYRLCAVRFLSTVWSPVPDLLRMNFTNRRMSLIRGAPFLSNPDKIAETVNNHRSENRAP